MRRFLTIGFKHDGTAEILKQSDAERSAHTQNFQELSGTEQKDYAEISVVEVGRGNIVRNRRFEDRDPLMPINQPPNPTIPTGPHHETKVGRVTLRHVGAPLPGAAVAASNVPVTPLNPRSAEEIAKDRETDYLALAGKPSSELKSLAQSEGVQFSENIDDHDLINAILDHRAAQSSEFPRA